MVQEITREFLAEKAVEYAEQKNSAWTNDCEGFIAGAMFVMQLLQQTPCTTMLPDEVRFRCTRFAHQCRLKGAVTNKDTVELYDKMFAGQ